MAGIAAAKPSRKEKALTFTGHLEELRRRLTWSVVVLIITSIVSFAFARNIFNFFQSRVPEDVVFVQIEVAELAGTYMKVCMYSGLVLALPFLMFQVVMFIRPALTPKEKGYLYLLLPGVLVFFLAGATFTYFVFLPPALKFLLDFPLVGGIEPMISIGNYISVVTKLLVVIGLIFELPLVMFFLAKIGVVTHKWLARYWRYAFVGAFIVSAIVTPTFDPINQSVVALPIMLLYALGILFAWIARRGKAPSSA